jgi:hypothetical protein
MTLHSFGFNLHTFSLRALRKQGWEKAREIRKNPWEWEILIFTGENRKNGKNCLFLKYMLKKHVKLLANK